MIILGYELDLQTKELGTLIKIADTCQVTQSLPGPGGVLDQDSVLIQAIELVWEVRAKKAEMDRPKPKRKGK